QMEEAIPVEISGLVQDEEGNGIEGVTMTLTGFSEFTTETDASGNYVLEAFAEKEYDLTAFHPLYNAEEISFTSEPNDYTLDPITLELALHKPQAVFAVNNDNVGDVTWDVPVGYFNETQFGW